MEGVGSVGGGTGTGGGGRAVGGGESARVSPSFVTVGARQRFEVKLRPGETTIVSWKKLVKDASKVKGPAVVPEAPAIAHPALESRIASGQPAENEANDAPPASRFSAVIEKIERLYMGKNSSDEEDLNDVPDDDEYDTEDSFIDDTELDEYFQVDNSAIKHDGFFVNRGKLERTNDPTLSSNQQPKKRRRKDLAKDHGGSDGGHVPNKHVKVGKKAAGSSMPLVENSNITSNCMAIPTVNCDDVKLQNQTSASEFYSKMKTTGTKTALDPSPLRVSNGDSTADGKDIDKQKAGVAPSKNHINKLKDGSEFFDASHQRSNDKISYAQCKSQSGRLLNNEEELDQSVQQKEKKNIRERSDINVPEGKNSMQTAKAPPTQKKEGSNVKPNNTMLETAIGELEKMVAESRPPSMEVSGADILSQAVKKRMPPEIKQKLAKVARLAQDGKISKELLLNRLMSIVGHLTQLSTLKRNLTTMVNKGLSAKREKDARVQQVKMQIEEMIKCRVQVLEKQAGASDDFQEIHNEEKEVLKRKCGMDEPLEDKICYLYDLFVEGLEEDAGPQVRKLYAEVAELWPKGLMDKHGVRRAICRSKDRKREKYSGYKVQEKLKKKKLITKTNKRAQVAASSVSQSQYVQALVADSGNHGSILVNRPVSNPTAANTPPQMPITLTNGPNVDLPKHDKVKGNFSSSNDVAKKKEKKKPELDFGEAQIRPEKLNSAQGEEKHKSHKQVAGPPQKTNLQLAPPPPPPPPSFEQHS